MSIIFGYVGGCTSVYTVIQPTTKSRTVLQSTGALDFSLHLNVGLYFSLQSTWLRTTIQESTVFQHTGWLDFGLHFNWGL